MTYTIQFEDVRFSYEGSDRPALDGINLTIQPGEIVLITGPAGSGKTTLCSCINGLIPHFHEGTLSGQVLVGPYNTRKARIGGLASLVGMVFQDPESQLVTSSVADEIAFGPENFGIPRDVINQRVQSALKATRLKGYDHREPHNLSGGEQQACVIAATYAIHPEIYIMDEPLANLDPVGRAHVLRLVIEVAKQREKTLVIVEHALEEVIPAVDRVIVMNQGKIVRDGTVEEVLSAGDIHKVFKRPALYRLAEDFQLEDKPLVPEDFYAALRKRYSLGTLQTMEAEAAPPSGNHPIIELTNVSYAYQPGNPTLKHINLKIQEGELVAIMGRNGSGKTTLVRHLIGFLHPSEGTVIVVGKNTAETPTHILAQDVGFCFQNPNHQLVSFNVRDEMLFGLRAHQIDPAEYDDRIHRALSIVGMQDFLDTEIFDLGKGQKQRLALASVLTLQPRILVIDEPTTGQDPEMTDEIFQIIRQLNQMGTTVLMITHKVDYAAAFAKRAVVIQQGQIGFDGPVEKLLSKPELMRQNSLDLPDTAKLAMHLSAHGVSPALVTYESLKQNIQALVEVSHGN